MPKSKLTGFQHNIIDQMNTTCVMSGRHIGKTMAYAKAYGVSLLAFEKIISNQKAERDRVNILRAKQGASPYGGPLPAVKIAMRDMDERQAKIASVGGQAEDRTFRSGALGQAYKPRNLDTNIAVTAYSEEEIVIKHKMGLSTSDVVSKICKASGVYPRYFHHAPDDLTNNKLLQNCCDYARSLGWEMQSGDTLPGPLGGYEFRKKYEGKMWAGGGYSVQSISCIMANCARKRFPYHRPHGANRDSVECPNFVIQFCYDHADVVKDMLSGYVRKCIENHLRS